jgi:hypothetical protein
LAGAEEAEIQKEKVKRTRPGWWCWSRCDQQRRVQRRNAFCVTPQFETVPALHGPGSSQRDEHHQNPYSPHSFAS